MARRTLIALLAGVAALAGTAMLITPSERPISVRMAAFGAETEDGEQAPPTIPGGTATPSTTLPPSTSVPPTTVPPTTDDPEPEPEPTDGDSSDEAEAEKADPAPKPAPTAKSRPVEKARAKPKETAKRRPVIQLGCKQTGEAEVTCRWSAPPEQATRLVLLRQSPDGEPEEIHEADEVAAGDHLDDRVEPGGAYLYRVVAGNDDDGVVAESNPVKVLVGDEAREKVEIDLACKATPEKVRCGWGDVPEAANRVALTREGGGEPSTVVFDTDDVEVHDAVDETVHPGETYVYRVFALDDEGKLGESAPAKVFTGATSPKGGMSLTCARVEPERIACKWGDPPAGSTKMALMRQGGGAEPRTVLMTTDMTTRSGFDTSILANETYTYRVAAGTEQGGKLAESEPVRVAPLGRSEAVRLTMACVHNPREGTAALVCEWSDPRIPVTSYRLFRRTDAQPAYRQVAVDTLRRIVDREVGPGTFGYLVHGLDADGRVAAIGEAAATCCTPAGDGR